ncbi:MAG: hypothetical protein QME61_01195 [Patescibacteria group bacterium]|nr:hypothetical protein [Patescibacteria group bacterium]
MKNFGQSKNSSIISLENAIDVITELIKKYGLEEIEKRKEEEIGWAKSLEEKRRIFKDLPTCQISKIVRELAKKEISPTNLAIVLQQRLNISKEIAEKLAKDLENKVLVLFQKIVPEKIEKKELKKEEFGEIKSSIPPKRDIYREPIE